MAVTKILAKDARLDKLIRYVVNPKKTGEQVFVSSVGCVPETAARPGRSPRSWPTRSGTGSRNGIWTGSR